MRAAMSKANSSSAQIQNLLAMFACWCSSAAGTNAHCRGGRALGPLGTSLLICAMLVR